MTELSARPTGTFKVAQIGTGNVGRHALTQLITDARFELTGVWVSSDSKAGKDAAELAGLDDSTGITATTDLDEVLATHPQCAVYTAMADNRLPDALEDYRKLLAAGVNVVGSSAVFLQYPWQTLPEELVTPIEDAAEAGNASLFVNGIDPGFANDVLPLAMTSLSQRIDEVRVSEIADYSTYYQPFVMTEIFGFGKPLDELPMLYQPTILSLAWGSVVRIIAAGLDLTLDEPLVEAYEFVAADRDYETVSCPIPTGTRAAVRFTVTGSVAGVPRVVLEHVTRTHPDQAPDWPKPSEGDGIYRIEVTGEPHLKVDFSHHGEHGDHNVSGMIVTAMRLVNAVEAVCSAPNGLVTANDLPLITGRGLVP
jgi:hypothetical protein